MVEQLLKYISDQQLLSEGDRCIVAASGGIDSTVLCHLFHICNFDFAIAHCNFQLRGDASDGDEKFMDDLANSLEVPFYSIKFDTFEAAKKEGVSIQMAARDLRYNWLRNLAKKEGFDKIVTAHHLDDNIETVLLNFTKGTGIKGLRGILPVNENIIRPLLFTSKKEIQAYALDNKIDFREDISNAEDKYQRNKIRHHIIPILEELNPNFQHTANKTITYLKDTELIYNEAIRKFQKSLLVEAEETKLWEIDILKLKDTPAPATVLYELIAEFGFNGDQVAQILQSIDNQPGKLFYTSVFKLVVDRKALIISKLKAMEKGQQIFVSETDKYIKLPDGDLQFDLEKNTTVPISNNNNSAIIDVDKIKWPLLLRHWQPGDIFQPLGMAGRKKKLQDFFSDNKLSIFEKEKIWILESDGAICWIVGHRLDERFKITSTTTHTLTITFS